MIAFLGRRRLEVVDLAALRVDARHHVADGAVLAGRVHRLEDQQQRARVLGVELALLFRQAANAFREQRRRILFVHQAAGPARIEVLQPDPFPRPRLDRLQQLADALRLIADLEVFSHIRDDRPAT